MTRKVKEVMKVGQIKELFQTFLAISAAATLSSVEGILGMNLDSSFMQQIHQHQFSLRLSNQPGHSQLIIGPNPLSNPVLIPIIPNNEKAYYIKLQSISINNGLHSLSNQTNVALLDSGNQLLGLTLQMAYQFVIFLRKSNVYCNFQQEFTPQYKKLTCFHKISQKFTFPNFQFIFSNRKLIMKHHNYVQSCYYALNNSIFVKQCDLALEVGGGLVLGAVFFHSFFINFDLKNKIIRIAHVSNNK